LPLSLTKARTGIQGLDEITTGGLPAGRPTLVAGGAGSGKTLLAMEFLLRGARDFGEPGVFVSFEETPADLAKNVASLGFDLPALERSGLIAMEHVMVEPHDIAEAGDYDLEGLFVRLQYAIDSVGARRVALDTMETIFGGFTNQALLRAELHRLFGWLKQRDLTVVLTGERSSGVGLTRHGLEEYVSDCVILLDQRVVDQVATRRLRIVKYRGSYHGTSEYPFLIDDRGISVLPLSSAGLTHIASRERVSSGTPGLDEMLEGRGFYRGSSVLVSGSAGSGKTSIAAQFADDVCRRGERCLLFAFEESPSQMLRNMASIGLDLQPWLDAGLLQIQANRPSLHGLEMHLVRFHQAIETFQPSAVVVDPITNLVALGSRGEINAMLVRLVDYLKMRGLTALFTSLTPGIDRDLEGTDVGISSLIDTWLLLRDVEAAGERSRVLYVLKSRGMAHSRQLRDFRMTSRGIEVARTSGTPGAS
jgi:circadian clock protein KaiC